MSNISRFRVTFVRNVARAIVRKRISQNRKILTDCFCRTNRIRDSHADFLDSRAALRLSGCSPFARRFAAERTGECFVLALIYILFVFFLLSLFSSFFLLRLLR